MRTISRRTFSIGISSLVASAALAPRPIHARETKEDAGKPVSKAQENEVKSFIHDFVDSLNAGDTSTIAMVDPNMYPNFFLVKEGDEDTATTVLQDHKIARVAIWEQRDVRQHSSGHLSAEVSYSGWYTPYYYATERWYVRASRDSYALVGDESVKLRVASGLKAGKVSTTLSLGGLKMDANLPPGTTLLLDTVVNTEKEQFLTTGIYQLGEGKTVEEAAGQPNNDGLIYIGPTPIPAGKKLDYAFVLPKPPVGNYMLQEFVINNKQVEPMPNGIIAEGFTVT